MASIRRVFVLLVLAFLCSSAVSVFADEGMWLFNAFPAEKVKAAYGFAPSNGWLEKVRLSSVRFNNGGSGSFVSADGLAFTNHHVGAKCIQELSKGGADYMKSGFYAKTRAEEAKCPDLELNQLVSIEDVTSQVNAAVKPDMPAAQAGSAQRAAMSQIEKDCATKSGLRCDVVTLYSGGMYHLYRYKKYTDVRLVFAPEFAAAFFGGDPDNFEYPRYDLDITFFRVYENGQPAKLPQYFNWSSTGINDGDLIFVSGNPGSTGRLLTMSQLAFLREVQYPWTLAIYKRRAGWLKQFSSGSPERAREAQEDIFGLENSLKATEGFNYGLLDKDLMAKKQSEEDKLKQALAGDPKKKQEFGDPFTAIDQAMAAERKMFLPLTYLEGTPRSTPVPPSALRGDLAHFARILVRVTAEVTKPNGERLREYRDSALPSLEQTLFSTAPIYKDLEIAILTESLQEAQEQLKGSDAAKAIDRALAGKSPADRAQELIAGTKLDDVSVRKQLYEGGQKAVAASTDPLIVVMRDIDQGARELRKQYDDQVDAIERTQGAKLAKLRFAEGGLNVPPDATFTLRLSYGAVRGFVEDGRGVVPKGTKVVPFTDFAGAFQHAAEHNSQTPYQLPQSWDAAKAKLNLQTPLNFVSTPDIIGGNSGSPVINKNAEVVGIIFDGNIQSNPWRFEYEDRIGRAVSVDSRAIQEALRKIYNAAPLADELLHGHAAAEAAAAAGQSGANR